MENDIGTTQTPQDQPFGNVSGERSEKPEVSVGEALQDEIKRNYELLGMYQEIGAAGMFGAMMIEADLKAAHEALKEDNVVKILVAYTKLKGSK